MKRFPVIALLALAGIAAASTVQAQSREVRAKVPFDFVVGSKHLAAGNYSLVLDSNGILVILNTDQGTSVLSMTENAGSTTNYSSRLVFDKYGDHYFLRDVLCPSIAVNAALPRSKQEKQIQTQVAWLGPDQVLLALN